MTANDFLTPKNGVTEQPEPLTSETRDYIAGRIAAEAERRLTAKSQRYYERGDDYQKAAYVLEWLEMECPNCGAKVVKE